MTAALRWGILGAAHIAARRVLPAIARSRRHAVLAVASRDPSRARDFGQRFGIGRVYDRYEALLADSEIDAVYNPLPNALHREWTERAARAGKHVLCEKPLAVNAADAAAMVAACAENGVVLQEAFMYRHHPQITRLRSLLRDGAIGEPWLVRAWFSFTTGPGNIRLDPALGGGGLLDVGCYAVSLSRLLLGEPVSATADAAYENGVDVRLSSLLTFAGGRAALIDCGLRAPLRQGCEIVGVEGAIVLRRPFQPEEEPAALLLTTSHGTTTVETPATNQYTLMMDDFAAAVLDGAPPAFPPSDAIANMRALDAVALAARERARRPIAPPASGDEPPATVRSPS
ncbi:MAG TPA: Gfo/Idh/MocA family oxidoreductase [bacterium]